MKGRETQPRVIEELSQLLCLGTDFIRNLIYSGRWHICACVIPNTPAGNRINSLYWVSGEDRLSSNIETSI